MRLMMAAMALAIPGAVGAQSASVMKRAPAQAEVMLAMSRSAAGWNADDLDRFLAVYAADATFVAGKEVARGKAAIAARYRRDYPAGLAETGALSFEPVAFRELGPGHAVLVARWRLTSAGGEARSGLTTLVFADGREGWKIVSDHSS